MPTWEELLHLATLLLGLAIGVSAASAQTLSASKSDAPPAEELADPIRGLMMTPGARVQAGQATLDFWWVKTLEATGRGEGWASIAEGTLVGAVRVSDPYPDIRGRRIKAGLYTLRYALQPMNGDHLGVSAYREFLLVSPASADSSPPPLGYQATIDLSKQTTGASHPAAWSLDPPSGATGDVLGIYKNDAGHEGVVFQVQTSSGPLTFGLILIGKIEA